MARVCVLPRRHLGSAAPQADAPTYVSVVVLALDLPPDVPPLQSAPLRGEVAAAVGSVRLLMPRLHVVARGTPADRATPDEAQ